MAKCGGHELVNIEGGKVGTWGGGYLFVSAQVRACVYM